MTVLKEQLRKLESSIVDRPPYCSGTLPLSADNFLLFYGKDDVARRVNLLNASDEALAHLSQTCDAATFGNGERDVLDESYRKAGKLDATEFSMKFDAVNSGLVDSIRTYLFEGDEHRPLVRVELYKLNVYGTGSFFKAHVDTPRSENMFGSLVIVFPTPHEGGALILRQEDKEWTVDSGALIADESSPCIAYTAFYSDVEHEVTPVKSGHRVTVTYNLYFAEEPDPVGVPPAHSQTMNESAFKSELTRLLDDPTFLPNGGCLGFGLRHQYPLDRRFIHKPKRHRKQGAPEADPQDSPGLHHLASYLKGSDAMVLRVFRALSLESSLKIVLRDVEYRADVLLNEHIELSLRGETETPLHHTLCKDYGGKLLTKLNYYKKDMDVYWVTHWTSPQANLVKKPFLAYGNQHSIEYTYTHVCLIVNIGGPGKRVEGQSTGDVGAGPRNTEQNMDVEQADAAKVDP
ncbi:hypothetical protein B0H21DRAFT_335574 [Amylocystis lapponica]|nr:hypothetical protein B0H21DRAFT_335574 [Amylocystis lapponica]